MNVISAGDCLNNMRQLCGIQQIVMFKNYYAKEFYQKNEDAMSLLLFKNSFVKVKGGNK